MLHFILQGLNSYFEIVLEKDGQPYYDFAPLPKEVFSESSILIRVNNSVDLDYEKSKTATFDVSYIIFSLPNISLTMLWIIPVSMEIYANITMYKVFLN